MVKDSDLNEFWDFQFFFLGTLQSGFELCQVDGGGVLAHEQVDHLLLVVVFHVLFVEPAETLQAVVHDALEVPASGAGDVGVGGAGAGVVLGDVVSVVSPGVFEVDDEVVGLFGVGGLHDGAGSQDVFELEAALGQDGPQDLIGDFALHEVGAVEAVEAVGAEDPFLFSEHHLFGGVFRVVLEVVVDGGHFLDQIVAAFELLPLAGKVEVVELVPHEGQLQLFEQLLEVQRDGVLPRLLLRQQVHAKHAPVHVLQLSQVPLATRQVALVRTVELHLRVDARLLPKGRHRPPHLQVRKQVPSHHHQLLGLAKVGHVPLGVHSPSVVAGASLDPAAASEQDVLYFPALEEDLEGPDGALHESDEPALVLELEDPFAHVEVPLEGSPGGVAFGVGLSRQAEVIVVAEVVAFFQEVVSEVDGVVVDLGPEFSVGFFAAEDQGHRPDLEDVLRLNGAHFLASGDEEEVGFVQDGEQAHEGAELGLLLVPLGDGFSPAALLDLQGLAVDQQALPDFGDRRVGLNEEVLSVGVHSYQFQVAGNPRTLFPIVGLVEEVLHHRVGTDYCIIQAKRQKSAKQRAASLATAPPKSFPLPCPTHLHHLVRNTALPCPLHLPQTRLQTPPPLLHPTPLVGFEHRLQTQDHFLELPLGQFQLFFLVEGLELAEEVGGSPELPLLLPRNLVTVSAVLVVQSFQVAEFIGVIIKDIGTIFRSRPDQLDQSLLAKIFSLFSDCSVLPFFPSGLLSLATAPGLPPGENAALVEGL